MIIKKVKYVNYRRLLLIIVATIILIINSCSNNPETFQDAKSFYFHCISNKSGSQFYNIEKDKNLLSQLYIETDSNAFFFTENFYNNVSDNYDSYILENYLNILVNIKNEKIDDNFKNQINNYLDKEFSNANFLNYESYKVLQLSNIDNLVNDKENSENFVHYLLNHYEPDTYNFFINKTEEYTSKESILNMNTALKILNNVGSIPEELKVGIYNNLTGQINNAEFFNYNKLEIEKNVFTEGMVILENCIMFNNLSDDLVINIDSFNDWFDYWKNLILSYIDSKKFDDVVITNGLLRIEKLNEYFNSSLVYSEYIDSLKELDWKDLLAKDIRLFYDYLQIINKCESYFPDIDTYFINYKLFLHYLKPDIRMKEQYYGLILAEELDYKIDHFLFEVSCSNHINDRTNLEEAYYFLLIIMELYEKNDNKVYLETYDKLYDKILSNNKMNFYETNLDEIYFYLFISNVFEFNIDANSYLNDEFIAVIKNKYLESKIDKSLYYYIMSCMLLNQSIDKKWLSSEVNGYFHPQQGFSVNTDKVLVNTISTYRMLMLINLLDIDINITYNIDISEYLSQVYGSAGGYYLQKVDEENRTQLYLDNFSLESWYMGYISYNIISFGS